MPTNKQLLTYAQAFAKGYKNSAPLIATTASAVLFHRSLRTGGPAIGKMLRGKSVTKREAYAAGQVILNGAYLVGFNATRGREVAEGQTQNRTSDLSDLFPNRVKSEKVDPFANMVSMMKGFFDER
jgi:hypothetical protein